MKPKILVILGSTREGRRGEKVANWAMSVLSKRSDANFELVDLRDWDFPFYNLPTSPSTEKGMYQSEIQKKWGEKIESAEGFILITPEYNHGYPAVLKNALDYLWFEWNHKPVVFISYGGLSGGIRAIEQLKQVVIELEMIPLIKSISIPRIKTLIDENGKFIEKSYDKKIESLGKYITLWSKELKRIRKNIQPK